MDSNSEGIVVYCTKGNVMFSSTGEIIESKQNVRKHKVNKNIINECFEKMKNFTEDIYWRSLLTRFARNNFPRNFKFTKNNLYYKINTKKHRSECFIDPDEPEKSFNDLKEFLKTKGFISNLEKKEINKFIEDNTEKRVEIVNWKDVTKNQDYYLIEYVLNLKDKYNLNKKETAMLESNIRFGVSSEFFNSENICIEDEKIKDIKNLKWDEKKRKFHINTEDIKFKKKMEKKGIQKCYSTYTIETNSEGTITIQKEIKRINILKFWEKFLAESIFKED